MGSKDVNARRAKRRYSSCRSGGSASGVKYSSEPIWAWKRCRCRPCRFKSDAIAVAAAGPHVPRSLLDQLAPGGRLVIPIGDLDEQKLIRIVRTPQGLHEESLGPVRFVPLVGREGWQDDRPID